MEKSNVYLVFRGSQTKEGFFARDFNIKDTLSSHVGILLQNPESNNWEVYHVLDFKDEFSDLRSQSLKDFLNYKKEKINHASIWKVTSVTDSVLFRINFAIKKYSHKNIKFDKKFSLNDSTKLYCSEFVNNILSFSNSDEFNFMLRKRKLNALYSRYFKKDTLMYYPVDIFQYNGNIVKEDEFFFE